VKNSNNPFYSCRQARKEICSENPDQRFCHKRGDVVWINGSRANTFAGANGGMVAGAGSRRLALQAKRQEVAFNLGERQ
jgi:hypothetical protein